jgi:hypothetical protein
MHTNNILVPEQFRIRQGNAAFKLTNSVLKYINQNMRAGGVFYYLAKASDCVIMICCYQSYILKAFKEQQLTGSDPI